MISRRLVMDTRMNAITERMILDIVRLVTSAATNRLSPRGGVKVTKGKIVETIAVMPSMNIPTMSRKTLAMRRNVLRALTLSIMADVTSGDARDSKEPCKACCSRYEYHDLAQVKAERRQTSKSFLRVISLCTETQTKRA